MQTGFSEAPQASPTGVSLYFKWVESVKWQGKEKGKLDESHSSNVSKTYKTVYQREHLQEKSGENMSY